MRREFVDARPGEIEKLEYLEVGPVMIVHIRGGETYTIDVNTKTARQLILELDYELVALWFSIHLFAILTGNPIGYQSEMMW